MKLIKSINITLLIVFMVLVGIDTTWAQPQEVTFNFTGAQQSFVVPPDVLSIHIQAWGAQGADANFSSGLGGLGGFAEGDLAVVPGQTLEIFVGGKGAAVADSFGGGGFNGGGDANSTDSRSRFERGGGGGASDVRVDGISLCDRVIVAGGGGGASGFDTDFGGAGGGLTGGDGGSCCAQKGFGGTQNSGGAGHSSPDVCLDGEFGVGGSSNTGVPTCAGGGGGWYGGGAGLGAGGGSSYIDGVENGSTTPGIREGDGMIVLTVIGINLSPTTATNDVFTNHLVIATLEVPEPNVLVTFEVISGPNAGLVSIPNNGECSPNNCATDGNGQVSWTYSSVLPGTDIIVASFEDQANQVIESDPVEKIWVVPIINVPIPTLNEYGMIITAGVLGLLAVIGLFVIRRRKVTA